MAGPKLITELPILNGVTPELLIAVGNTAGLLYQTQIGFLTQGPQGFQGPIGLQGKVGATCAAGTPDLRNNSK
jgi:hypothetical protein